MIDFLYALLDLFIFIIAIAGTLLSAFMSWLVWFDSDEQFGNDLFMSFGMIFFPSFFLYMVYYWAEKLF